MITENERKERKKIMIVDDEPDINEVLKAVLKRRGFYVDTYDKPIISLRDYCPRFYDLLILDIKMPQINGFELY